MQMRASAVVLTVSCILALLTDHPVYCARILAVFLYPGKSHFLVAQPLLEALAKRGHQVVVMSFFSLPDGLPNYTHIDIDGAVELKTDLYTMDEYYTKDFNTIRKAGIWGGDVSRCEQILQHPNVQNLIRSQEKFDLLLTEVFGSECHLGFSYRFQVPIVVLFSSKPFSWNTDPLGSPEHPAYVSSTQFAYLDDMTLMQRIINTLYFVQHRLEFVFYSRIPAEAIARRHFGSSMPPLAEIAANVSLLMVNQHFSINRAKAHVPAVVEVGGIHIKEAQRLPQDLDRWLNESRHGVVYFSMGSMLRADSLPTDKRDALLQAFAELPQRVLWKWEGDSLPGQPDNVRVAKWLPQRDILNHPNVRLFITHGGLLGTMEAVDCGVPMVGIPIFGDQLYNMRYYASDGVAEVIDYKMISKDLVLGVLRTVLDDPSYTRNAKRLSRVFRDQPQSPLSRAIYWTEYVIRHGGAPHMRSRAAVLAWYQYLLLDVVAVVLLALVASLAVVFVMLKKLYNYVFPQRRIKTSNKASQKTVKRKTT